MSGDRSRIWLHRCLVRKLASDSPESSCLDLTPSFQPLRRKRPQPSSDHSITRAATHLRSLRSGWGLARPAPWWPFWLEHVSGTWISFSSKCLMIQNSYCFWKDLSAPCGHDIRSIYSNSNLSHPAPPYSVPSPRPWNDFPNPDLTPSPHCLPFAEGTSAAVQGVPPWVTRPSLFLRAPLWITFTTFLFITCCNYWSTCIYDVVEILFYFSFYDLRLRIISGGLLNIFEWAIIFSYHWFSI